MNTSESETLMRLKLFIFLLLVFTFVGCATTEKKGKVQQGSKTGQVATSTKARAPQRPGMPRLEWVRLPRGSFQMGSSVGGPDERPMHTVQMAAFELLKTEVTAAQYLACLKAGACTSPNIWKTCNVGQAGREKHPANCLDWHQARKFCAWVGARLPSEAQWEYAARSGGQDRTYPWGAKKPSCGLAVIFYRGDGCGKGGAWPVCSKPEGNTLQGLCDMAGNVWEWVEDPWHDTYHGAPANGTAWIAGGAPRSRVMRGGSWFSAGENSFRTSFRIIGVPSRQHGYVGFRCARPLTRQGRNQTGSGLVGCTPPAREGISGPPHPNPPPSGGRAERLHPA